MSPFTVSQSSGFESSTASSVHGTSPNPHHHHSTHWNIEDTPGSLPTIPPCYPMAQTSVMVRFDGGGDGPTSPSGVASRISNCLRDRSIYTTYDDENATALGVNVDHVELCIKLFHSPPEPGPIEEGDHTPTMTDQKIGCCADAGAGHASIKQPPSMDMDHMDTESEGVVVEVTRKRGCTMSFHADCSAILSAARGVHAKRSSDSITLETSAVARAASTFDNDDDDDGDFPPRRGGRGTSIRRGPSSPCRRNRRPTLSRSRSLPANTHSARPGAGVISVPPPTGARPPPPAPPESGGGGITPDENVMLALESVENLLGKDRMDATLLGMQSLYMLTSSSPNNEKDRSAAYASNLILLRHDYGEMADQTLSILTIVENLVRDWALSTDEIYHEDDDSIIEEEEEEYFQESQMEGEAGPTTRSVAVSETAAAGETSTETATGSARRARPAAVGRMAVSTRFDDYYSSTMHNLALGVLSNILTNVATQEGTSWSDIPPQIQEWIHNGVVPLLLHEMETVVSNFSFDGTSGPTDRSSSSFPSRPTARPHDASLAVQSLIAVSNLSPEVGRSAVQMGATPVLRSLRQIGSAVHAILAEDCDAALTALGEHATIIEEEGEDEDDYKIGR